MGLILMEIGMVFNSLEFLGFAVAVFALVWLAGRVSGKVALRNAVLLLASYWFYGLFNVGFLAILLYVTAINFCAPLLMERRLSRSVPDGAAVDAGDSLKGGRKGILWTAIVLSLLPLLTYKYSIFLIDTVLGVDGFATSDFAKRLLLPVGISFFTFQALSYTIDTYYGKVKPTRNFLDVALFVSFFPTVLSGPIEKARNLLPQLQRLHQASGDEIRDGITTFIWGVFKKVVIADRLGAYVDMAYGGVEYQTGGTLALAAIFYSIQIYCDFSGYSDMALGVAKCLGFDLTRNFRFPYFSTSIKSFWRKWHISLTSWFTEYVYFPLGGSRVRLKARWVFNIAMVFILSGIWHGAAWTFLIWGAMHALLYLAEHFLGLQKKEYTHWWSKAIAGIVVFVAVTIAWIFFRAADFEMASQIVGRIFTMAGGLKVDTGASAFTFAVNLALLAVFAWFEWRFYKDSAAVADSKESGASYGGGAMVTSEGSVISPPRGAIWVVCVLLMLGLFGVTSDNFVYFQF